MYVLFIIYIYIVVCSLGDVFGPLSCLDRLYTYIYIYLYIYKRMLIVNLEVTLPYVD